MTKALIVGATLVFAAAANADIYNDSTGDVFQSAPSNMDISSVSVTNDGVNLYISVTTVGFETWTKYMLFLNTGNGATTGSNAWGRPVDFSGQQINRFIGSWVDAGSDNSQNVGWDGANWDWGNSSTFSNSVNSNTVSWAISLASLGLGAGDTLRFDVATAGGNGNDAGVDHLSRADMATDWWTNTSYSGQFLEYFVIPTPGVLSLLGIAGLVGSRRRRV